MGNAKEDKNTSKQISFSLVHPIYILVDKCHCGICQLMHNRDKTVSQNNIDIINNLQK